MVYTDYKNTRGLSSAGRAFGWQPKGRRFEPDSLHMYITWRLPSGVFCYSGGGKTEAYSLDDVDEPIEVVFCVYPFEGMGNFLIGNQEGEAL